MRKICKQVFNLRLVSVVFFVCAVLGLQAAAVEWKSGYPRANPLSVCGAPDTTYITWVARQAIPQPRLEVTLPSNVVYMGYVAQGTTAVQSVNQSGQVLSISLAALAAGQEVDVRLVCKAEGQAAATPQVLHMQVYNQAQLLDMAGAGGTAVLTYKINVARLNVIMPTARLDFSPLWRTERRTMDFTVLNSEDGALAQLEVEVDIPACALTVDSASLAINGHAIAKARFAHYVRREGVGNLCRYTLTFTSSDFANSLLSIGNTDGYLAKGESFVFSLDITPLQCGDRGVRARAVWGCGTSADRVVQPADAERTIAVPDADGGMPLLTAFIKHDIVTKSIRGYELPFAHVQGNVNIRENLFVLGTNRYTLEVANDKGAAAAANVQGISLGNTINNGMSWIMSHRVYYKNRPNDPVSHEVAKTYYTPTGLYVYMEPYRSLADSLVNVVYTVDQLLPGDTLVLEVIEGRKHIDRYSLLPAGTDTPEETDRLWVAGVGQEMITYTSACGSATLSATPVFFKNAPNAGSNTWIKPGETSLYPGQTRRLMVASKATVGWDMGNVRVGSNARTIVTLTLPEWLDLDTLSGKGITLRTDDGVSMLYRHALTRLPGAAKRWQAQFAYWPANKANNKLYLDIKGGTSTVEVTGNITYTLDYYTGDIDAVAGNRGSADTMKLIQQHVKVRLLKPKDGLNLYGFAVQRTRLGYSSATDTTAVDPDLVNLQACVVGDTIALEWDAVAGQAWNYGYARFEVDNSFADYVHAGTWLYVNGVKTREVPLQTLAVRTYGFDLTQKAAYPIADGASLRLVSRWYKNENTAKVHKFKARMFAATKALTNTQLVTPPANLVLGDGEYQDQMESYKIKIRPWLNPAELAVQQIGQNEELHCHAFFVLHSSNDFFPKEYRRFFYVDTVRIRVPRGYCVPNAPVHYPYGMEAAKLSYSYKLAQTNGDTIYVFGLDHLYHTNYNTPVPAGKYPPINSAATHVGFVCAVQATPEAPQGVTHFPYYISYKGVMPGLGNSVMENEEVVNGWAPAARPSLLNMIAMPILSVEVPNGTTRRARQQSWEVAATNYASEPVKHFWYYLHANDNVTGVDSMVLPQRTLVGQGYHNRWVKMDELVGKNNSVLYAHYQPTRCADTLWLYPVYGPEGAAPSWTPDLGQPVFGQAANVYVGKPIALYSDPSASALRGGIAPLATTSRTIDNIRGTTYGSAVGSKIYMGKVFPVQLQIQSTEQAVLVKPEVEITFPEGVSYIDSVGMEGFVHYMDRVAPIQGTALHAALQQAQGQQRTVRLKLWEVLEGAWGVDGLPGVKQALAEEPRTCVITFYARTTCEVSYEGVQLEALFDGMRPCGVPVTPHALESDPYLLGDVRAYDLAFAKVGFVSGVADPGFFDECFAGSRTMEMRISKQGTAPFEQDTLVIEMPRYLMPEGNMTYTLLNKQGVQVVTAIMPVPQAVAMGDSLHYYQVPLDITALNIQPNAADGYTLVYSLQVAHNPHATITAANATAEVRYLLRGMATIAGCGTKRAVMAEATTPVRIEKAVLTLTKRVVLTTATSQGYRLSMIYNLRNNGNLPLTQVNVAHNLRGMLGNNAVYASARVRSLAAGGNVPNAAYNGNTDTLLIAAGTLAAGATDSIAVDIVGLMPTRAWQGQVFDFVTRAKARGVTPTCDSPVVSDTARLHLTALAWQADTIHHPQIDTLLRVVLTRIGNPDAEVHYRWAYDTTQIVAPKHKAHLGTANTVGYDAWATALQGAGSLPAGQHTDTLYVQVRVSENFDPAGKWLHANMAQLNGASLLARAVATPVPDSVCYIHIQEDINNQPRRGWHAKAYLLLDTANVLEGQHIRPKVVLTASLTVPVQFDLATIYTSTAVPMQDYTPTLPIKVLMPAGDTVAYVDIATLVGNSDSCVKRLDMHLIEASGRARVMPSFADSIGTVEVIADSSRVYATISNRGLGFALGNDMFVVAIGENNTLRFNPQANDYVGTAPCCATRYKFRDGADHLMSMHTLSGQGVVTFYPSDNYAVSYKAVGWHYAGYDSIYYVAESLCDGGLLTRDTALMVFKVLSPDMAFADSGMVLDFAHYPGQLKASVRVHNVGDTTFTGPLHATLYVGNTRYVSTSAPVLAMPKGAASLAVDYYFSLPAELGTEADWRLVINDSLGRRVVSEHQMTNNTYTFRYHPSVMQWYTCGQLGKIDIFEASKPTGVQWGYDSIVTTKGHTVTVDTTDVSFYYHSTANGVGDGFLYSYRYGSSAGSIQVYRQAVVTAGIVSVAIVNPGALCKGKPYTLRAEVPGATGVSYTWEDLDQRGVVGPISGSALQVQLDFNGYTTARYVVTAAIGLPGNQCVDTDTVTLTLADSLRWLVSPRGAHQVVTAATATHGGLGWDFVAKANVQGAQYRWSRLGTPGVIYATDTLLHFARIEPRDTGVYVVEAYTACAAITDTLRISYLRQAVDFALHDSLLTLDFASVPNMLKVSVVVGNIGTQGYTGPLHATLRMGHSYYNATVSVSLVQGGTQVCDYLFRMPDNLDRLADCELVINDSLMRQPVPEDNMSNNRFGFYYYPSFSAMMSCGQASEAPVFLASEPVGMVSGSLQLLSSVAGGALSFTSAPYMAVYAGAPTTVSFGYTYAYRPSGTTMVRVIRSAQLSTNNFGVSIVNGGAICPGVNHSLRAQLQGSATGVAYAWIRQADGAVVGNADNIVVNHDFAGYTTAGYMLQATLLGSGQQCVATDTTELTKAGMLTWLKGIDKAKKYNGFGNETNGGAGWRWTVQASDANAQYKWIAVDNPSFVYSGDSSLFFAKIVAAMAGKYVVQAYTACGSITDTLTLVHADTSSNSGGGGNTDDTNAPDFVLADSVLVLDFASVPNHLKVTVNVANVGKTAYTGILYATLHTQASSVMYTASLPVVLPKGGSQVCEYVFAMPSNLGVKANWELVLNDSMQHYIQPESDTSNNRYRFPYYPSVSTMLGCGASAESPVFTSGAPANLVSGSVQASLSGLGVLVSYHAPSQSFIYADLPQPDSFQYQYSYVPSVTGGLVQVKRQVQLDPSGLVATIRHGGAICAGVNHTLKAQFQGSGSSALYRWTRLSDGAVVGTDSNLVVNHDFEMYAQTGYALQLTLPGGRQQCVAYDTTYLTKAGKLAWVKEVDKATEWNGYGNETNHGAGWYWTVQANQTNVQYRWFAQNNPTFVQSGDSTLFFRRITKPMEGVYLVQAYSACDTITDTLRLVYANHGGGEVLHPDFVLADSVLVLDFVSQAGKLLININVANKGTVAFTGNLELGLAAGAANYLATLPTVLNQGATVNLTYVFTIPSGLDVARDWGLTLNPAASVVETDYTNNLFTFPYYPSVSNMLACGQGAQAPVFVSAIPQGLIASSVQTAVSSKGVQVDYQAVSQAFLYPAVAQPDTFVYQYAYKPFAQEGNVLVKQRVLFDVHGFGVAIAYGGDICANINHRLEARPSGSSSGIGYRWIRLRDNALVGTNSYLIVNHDFVAYDTVAYMLEATLYNTNGQRCMARDTTYLTEAGALQWSKKIDRGTEWNGFGNETNGGAGWQWTVQANQANAKYRWIAEDNPGYVHSTDSVFYLQKVTAAMAGRYIVQAYTPCDVVSDTLTLVYIDHGDTSRVIRPDFAFADSVITLDFVSVANHVKVQAKVTNKGTQGFAGTLSATLRAGGAYYLATTSVVLPQGGVQACEYLFALPALLQQQADWQLVINDSVGHTPVPEITTANNTLTWTYYPSVRSMLACAGMAQAPVFTADLPVGLVAGSVQPDGAVGQLPVVYTALPPTFTYTGALHAGLFTYRYAYKPTAGMLVQVQQAAALHADGLSARIAHGGPICPDINHVLTAQVPGTATSLQYRWARLSSGAQVGTDSNLVVNHDFAVHATEGYALQVSLTGVGGQQCVAYDTTYLTKAGKLAWAKEVDKATEWNGYHNETNGGVGWSWTVQANQPNVQYRWFAQSNPTVMLSADSTFSLGSITAAVAGRYTVQAYSPCDTIADTLTLVYADTTGNNENNNGGDKLPDLVFADSTLLLDFAYSQQYLAVSFIVANVGAADFADSLAVVLYAPDSIFALSRYVALAQGAQVRLTYIVDRPETLTQVGAWRLSLRPSATTQEANRDNNHRWFTYYPSVTDMYLCQGQGSASLFTIRQPSDLLPDSIVAQPSARGMQASLLAAPYAWSCAAGAVAPDAFVYRYSYGQALAAISVQQRVAIVAPKVSISLASASHACPDKPYTLMAQVQPLLPGMHMEWTALGQAPVPQPLQPDGSQAVVSIPFAGYDTAYYRLQVDMGITGGTCAWVDTLAVARLDHFYWVDRLNSLNVDIMDYESDNGGLGHSWTVLANVDHASYRWYRADAPTVTQSDSATLRLNKVTEVEAGTYVVECATACDTLRDTLHLSVQQAFAHLIYVEVDGNEVPVRRYMEVLLPCGFTAIRGTDSVDVVYRIAPGGTTTHRPSPYRMYVGNQGKVVHDTIVVSVPGQADQVYVLAVVSPLDEDRNVVVEKNGSVLIANNNPNTNGGYSFAHYQWFRNKDGYADLISTQQNYYASTDGRTMLDTAALYHARLVTVPDNNGVVDTVITCPMRPLGQYLAVKLYPNPVPTRHLVNVEVPQEVVDQFPEVAVKVYNNQGRVVDEQKYQGAHFQFQAPLLPGSYIVRVSCGRLSQLFTIVAR